MKKPEVRTWIELDKKALEHNYKTFRNLIGRDCKLMAIVKSNAYGHGLIESAKLLEKFGADWLGVDSITEALALRKDGIKKPILVLGYTMAENITEAAKSNISLTLSSFEGLKDIQKTKVKTSVHIKVDTGMHRQGFYLTDIDRLITELKKSSGIKVEGVYTHLAAAKNPSFPHDTNEQLEKFKLACDKFEKAGFTILKHAAASSGAIVYSKSHLDMVRIGMSLYGLWPSNEVKFAFEDKISIKPVLSWYSLISEIKNISEDGGVGYDFTEKVEKGSKIAIIPIGYWHGFPRSLSSIGMVLVNGRRAKVLGRVSMDMIVIDVTSIKNLKVGDVVTIIGKDGKEEISAEEVANRADASWYEILARINPLIKREYI